MNILLVIFACIVWADLRIENSHLKQTNQVLIQTLRALSGEVQVGSECKDFPPSTCKLCEGVMDFCNGKKYVIEKYTTFQHSFLFGCSYPKDYEYVDNCPSDDQEGCRIKKMRSGGFCVSSVRLGDTQSPSICRANAAKNNKCHGQLDGQQFFFLDTNGGCFCSTDDCTGQFSSSARTIYKATCAQEDIDCVLGSYNMDDCGSSCYIRLEITEPAKGFGQCKNRYVECADGDGECRDSGSDDWYSDSLEAADTITMEMEAEVARLSHNLGYNEKGSGAYKWEEMGEKSGKFCTTRYKSYKDNNCRQACSRDGSSCYTYTRFNNGWCHLIHICASWDWETARDSSAVSYTKSRTPREAEVARSIRGSGSSIRGNPAPPPRADNRGYNERGTGSSSYV